MKQINNNEDGIMATVYKYLIRIYKWLFNGGLFSTTYQFE